MVLQKKRIARSQMYILSRLISWCLTVKINYTYLTNSSIIHTYRVQKK